jgi:hypothetical protein
MKLFFSVLILSLSLQAWSAKKCGSNYINFTVEELTELKTHERISYFETVSFEKLVRIAFKVLEAARPVYRFTNYEYRALFEETLQFLAGEKKFDPERIAVFKSFFPNSEILLENEEIWANQILDAVLGVYKLDVLKATEVRLRETPSLYGEEFHWNDDLTLPETGYLSFHRIFQHRNPPRNSRVVDIGAGFARMKFYLAIFRPDIRYFGIELIPERVAAAKAALERLSLGADGLTVGDLSKVQLPRADIYYAFYPTAPPTSKILFHRLKQLSYRQHLEIWVRYGFDGIEEAERLWLKQTDNIGSEPNTLKIYESGWLPSSVSKSRGEL